MKINESRTEKGVSPESSPRSSPVHSPGIVETRLGECCCSVQTFELGDTSMACSDLARVGYQMLYQHSWLRLGVIHHLYSV